MSKNKTELKSFRKNLISNFNKFTRNQKGVNTNYKLKNSFNPSKGELKLKLILLNKKIMSMTQIKTTIFLIPGFIKGMENTCEFDYIFYFIFYSIFLLVFKTKSNGISLQKIVKKYYFK